jgi:hypothetical protein
MHRCSVVTAECAHSQLMLHCQRTPASWAQPRVHMKLLTTSAASHPSPYRQLPCTCPVNTMLMCLQSRRAMPCPQGTYKASLSNTAGCTRCPPGSTTRALRSTVLSDCIVALPGYQVTTADPSTATNGLMIRPCPVGTFSTGYTTEPCRPCPWDLLTPSTGSTSAGACSAPPGHGFYCSSGQPTGVPPASTAMLQESGATCVLACPDGSFKKGWGRSPCVSCGVNFRSTAGATSAQQCYIPPGWGTTTARDGSRTLVARKCFNGLYGASEARYGNTRRFPCQVRCVLSPCRAV